MANENEITIEVTADTADLTAQLRGVRTNIEATFGPSGALGTAVKQSETLYEQLRRELLGVSTATVTLNEQQKAVQAEIRAAVAPTQDWSNALGQVGAASTSSAASLVGFGLSAGVVTIAIEGLSTVVMFYMRQAEGMVQSQVAMNRAIEAMDFKGAISQLETASKALDEYHTRVRLVTDSTAGFMTRIKAFFGAVTTDTELLKRQMRDAAEATHETFIAFEQGQGSLRVMGAEAHAAAAGFANMARSAQSIGGLQAALAGQADALRAVGEAALKTAENEDRRYAANQRKLIDQLRLLGNLDQATKLSADLAESLDQRAKQRAAERATLDAQDAARRMANAREVGAALAQQYDAEARLAEIKGRGVQRELALDAQALTIAQQRVVHEAQFNAQALTNVEQYYDQRLAVVRAAAAAELATLTSVYQQQRAALVAQATGLPDQSLEQQRINARIVQLDQEMGQRRREIGRETVNALGQIENERQAAIDANNQRAFQLEATFMQQRLALGRATQQQELEFLRQSAQNAALPMETRRQAEVAYYQKSRELAAQHLAFMKGIGQATVAQEIQYYIELAGAANTSLQTRQQAVITAQQLIRKAEQDAFELARAQGRVTEEEAVQHARAVALSWKEGTQQRIDAEKKFAQEARQLWDGLATAGRSLEDLAIGRLAEQGRALSQANIAGEVAKIKTQAEALNAVWQRGGTLTKEQLELVRRWSDANADLGAKGASVYSALAASSQKLDDGIHGVVASVESLAGQGFQQASAAATQFGRAGDQAFDTVGQSLDQLVQQTQVIGNLMGSGIVQGVQTSMEQVQRVFGNAIQRMREQAENGFGLIGEGLAANFERRLIQMIDAAGSRN